ncbi:uncharacterized protein LOC135161925 isoform X2 [Diachasmimorpha longicaudata]|uniref:uncharacterized protein LOC135161925 isoform X2 n=1 Tax=Diachasmimorpha longicaudata TaxID=58733 RepID=UPI0030B8DB7C
MSNYQFIVFSEKGQNGIKPQDRSRSSSTEEMVLPSTPDQVINSPTDENTRPTRRDAKKQIRVEPSRSRKREIPSDPLQLSLDYQQDSTENASALKRGGKSSVGKAKIPRPANAFMLFANDWRKKLAADNPRESNKDISVRLGALWKSLEKHEKEKYFAFAREVDAEHKRKYPDYVYNPKEARLRKAMREQNRELSRQSVLSAPISTPENATNNTGSNSTPVSTNFINLSMTCSSPAPPGQSGSSLSGSSSYNPGRINPWFPIGHATPGDHVKQMIPYRMMQAHQRTFDKAKDVLRNQTSIAECGTAFPSSSPASCYPGDFSLHGSAQQSRISPVDSDTRTNGTGLESNDYCGIGEFTDGQKWHPYQNGPTTYHSRSGPMTKISTRHAMQNVNTINSHAQGPWNQFCGVSMSPMAAQSPLIRSPRHMVMLQNQQERHCFPDELPLPYVTNKIDLAPRMPPGYSQSTYREAEKGLDGAPRWQSGNPEPPVNNLMTQQPEAHVEDNQKQPKKEETKDFTDDETDKPEMPSKQPLPGFHQAFGSTEIGRFSRSEFFANMVSENGNLIPEGYFFPSIIPYPHKKPSAEEIGPNECYWIGPIVGFPMANMTNPSKCTPYMELPPRMNRDWMFPGRMMPQDHVPMMERPEFFFHDNYPRFNVPERVHFKEDQSTDESSTSRTEGSRCPFEGSEDQEKNEGEESDEQKDVEEEEDDQFINVDDD